MRLSLTNRRTWLTAGALSAVLTGGLTAQLVPTAAADPSAGTIRANTDAAPVEVPAPSAGPAAPSAFGPAGPAALPIAQPPAAQPVTEPAAKPVTQPAAKPAAKPATSGDVCSGAGWQAARGRRALASLRHPTPAGVTVAFKGSRAGYLGLTYVERRHVDVFVRPCSKETSTLLRHVMAHEMGHAYDAAHMTAADRAAYKAMRGIPASTPWFGCSYCSDFATPAGDFAETYAQWQRGTFDSRTKIAPMPGSAALAALGARFFSR